VYFLIAAKAICGAHRQYVDDFAVPRVLALTSRLHPESAAVSHLVQQRLQREKSPTTFKKLSNHHQN
jgi:hypothetical protein